MLLVEFIMNLIFRLMPVVGMGLILFVVPTLALATLVLSVIVDKAKGFLLNFGCFIGYLIWLVAIFAIMLNFSIGKAPWWIPAIELGLLLGSIPHGIMLIYASRTKNRWNFWVGILGLTTTILATVGIGLLCYSARFF